MADLIASIPEFAGLIEKAGVIGLLLIVLAVMGKEMYRLRIELTKTYKQRDTYRMGYALCKQACDVANIKVDLHFMNELMSGETA